MRETVVRSHERWHVYLVCANLHAVHIAAGVSMSHWFAHFIRYCLRLVITGYPHCSPVYFQSDPNLHDWSLSCLFLLSLGLTLAIVVFLVFCNFYPITSIANVYACVVLLFLIARYGTMTLVFGLSLLIMFVISATTFPFSASRPWTAQVSQMVNTSDNTSTIILSATWVDASHFPSIKSSIRAHTFSALMLMVSSDGV